MKRKHINIDISLSSHSILFVYHQPAGRLQRVGPV